MTNIYKFEEFKIFLPGKAKRNQNDPVIWKNSSDFGELANDIIELL